MKTLEKAVKRMQDSMLNQYYDSMKMKMHPMLTVCDNTVEPKRVSRSVCPSWTGMDMASGVDDRCVGTVQMVDGNGNVRVLIGNIGEETPGRKTMGQDVCAPAPRKTVKERLSPVIAALVDYAERTGRAEAQVGYEQHETRRLADKVDHANDSNAELRYQLDRHMEREARLESDNKVMYAELRKRDEKAARAKAKALKAKKATKKTVKKSK